MFAGAEVIECRHPRLGRGTGGGGAALEVVAQVLLQFIQQLTT